MSNALFALLAIFSTILIVAIIDYYEAKRKRNSLQDILDEVKPKHEGK